MKKSFWLIFCFSIAFNAIHARNSLSSLLQKRVIQLNKEIFLSMPELHSLASEISNKGNTTDLSLRELYWNTYQDKQDIEEFISTQLPDGSWKDIDYRDNALSNWQPTNHVSRLLYLSRVYEDPASEFFHQKRVALVLHRGLKFWFSTKPVCRNWWYNQIGIPRFMGLVFLFLHDELSPEELKGAVEVMDHSGFRMTGQNKVWLAGNVLLKAILTNDDKLAEAARDTIASEIYLTKNEGIQPDFSFHQHGPQQQFGNYGLSYLSSMAYFANVFKGTALAFKSEQMTLLRNYTVKGENHVVWKGYMDVCACGRQLFKEAQKGKALIYCIAVNQMLDADPEFASVYRDILQRNLHPGSTPEKPLATHYWCSDLSVFRSPEAYISVRACSPRVKGTEFTNNENKEGHFLADGTTMIMRRGDEYKDIFPFWSWNFLPGITAPVLDSVMQHKKDDYRNPDAFVGGVTQGNLAVSTFRLARNKTHAEKSWFWLNNKLICLGANISSTTGRDVITGVNQCLQNGNAVVEMANRRIDVSDTIITSNEIASVWHDSVGYVFPGKQNCVLSLKNQTGNWHQIADPYDSQPVSGKVFKLYLQHGFNAAETPFYSYLVIPSVSENELKTYLQHPDVKVLINQPDIQAVKQTNDSVFEFVFQSPSRANVLPSGGWLKAENAGLMILSYLPDQQLLVSVSDPTQQLKTFKLLLSGCFSGESARYDNEQKVTSLEIQLPTGFYAGKSVQILLSRGNSSD